MWFLYFFLSYQSGHNSSKCESSSNSGASFCFIQRSGISKIVSDNGAARRTWTHEREVAFHGSKESLAILLWGNDGRFTPTGSTQKGRLLYPTFQFLVPCVRSNVICLRVESNVMVVAEKTSIPTIPTTSSLFWLSTWSKTSLWALI